jgi:hypothetical protein
MVDPENRTENFWRAKHLLKGAVGAEAENIGIKE